MVRTAVPQPANEPIKVTMVTHAQPKTRTNTPMRAEILLEIQRNSSVVTTKFTTDGPGSTTSRSRGWLLGRIVASHV
jgi:hypothetical protein